MTVHSGSLPAAMTSVHSPLRDSTTASSRGVLRPGRGPEANSWLWSSCIGVGIWLGVGAVIALVLIAVVVIGRRRPRSAEDELGQPVHPPAQVGTPGSIDAPSLREWLLSAKEDRRTGTLQLTAGGRTSSLYFLF